MKGCLKEIFDVVVHFAIPVISVTIAISAVMSHIQDRKRIETELAVVAAVDGAAMSRVEGAWVYRGKDGKVGVGKTVEEAVADWRGESR